MKSECNLGETSYDAAWKNLWMRMLLASKKLGYCADLNVVEVYALLSAV